MAVDSGVGPSQMDFWDGMDFVPVMPSITPTERKAVWDAVASNIRQQLLLHKGIRIPTLGSFDVVHTETMVGNKTVILQRPVFHLARNLGGAQNLENKDDLAGLGKQLEPLKYARVATEASVSRREVECCILGTMSLLYHCLEKGVSVALVLRDVGVLLIEGSMVLMRFYPDFLEKVNRERIQDRAVLKGLQQLGVVVPREVPIASLSFTGRVLIFPNFEHTFPSTSLPRDHLKDFGLVPGEDKRNKIGLRPMRQGMEGRAPGLPVPAQLGSTARAGEQPWDEEVMETRKLPVMPGTAAGRKQPVADQGKCKAVPKGQALMQSNKEAEGAQRGRGGRGERKDSLGREGEKEVQLGKEGERREPLGREGEKKTRARRDGEKKVQFGKGGERRESLGGEGEKKSLLRREGEKEVQLGKEGERMESLGREGEKKTHPRRDGEKKVQLGKEGERRGSLGREGEKKSLLRREGEKKVQLGKEGERRGSLGREGEKDPLGREGERRDSFREGERIDSFRRQEERRDSLRSEGERRDSLSEGESTDSFGRQEERRGSPRREGKKMGSLRRQGEKKVGRKREKEAKDALESEGEKKVRPKGEENKVSPRTKGEKKVPRGRGERKVPLGREEEKKFRLKREELKYLLGREKKLLPGRGGEREVPVGSTSLPWGARARKPQDPKVFILQQPGPEAAQGLRARPEIFWTVLKEPQMSVLAGYRFESSCLLPPLPSMASQLPVLKKREMVARGPWPWEE